MARPAVVVVMTTVFWFALFAIARNAFGPSGDPWHVATVSSAADADRAARGDAGTTPVSSAPPSESPSPSPTPLPLPFPRPEAQGLWEKYVARHRAAVERNTYDPNERWVVITMGIGGGFGNRILPIVSAWILALYGNALMAIEWPEGPERYNEFFVDPYPGFHSAEVTKLTGKVDERVTVGTDYGFRSKESIDTLLCKSFFDVHGGHTLQLFDVGYFASYFATNERFRSQIERDFGDKLFSHVYTWLFTPTPSLQTLADEFVTKFVGDRPLITVQVRAYDLKFKPATPSAALARDLTAPVPDLGSGSRRLLEERGYVASYEHLLRFIDCTRGLVELFKRERPDGPSPVIFILTDQPLAREEFRAHFGDDVISYATHIAKGEFRHGVAADQEAVVDHLIGSHATRMIASHPSTYGMITYGRARVVPFLVRMPDEADTDPICAQVLPTSEPSLKWTRSRFDLAKKNYPTCEAPHFLYPLERMWDDKKALLYIK